MKTIRIGSGAGYAGDRLEPALDLIKYGNLDYIIFECLAERTIALAQQRKLQNPQKGYDEFLSYRMERIIPLLAEHPVKVITNMGAANPIEAAKVVKNLALKLGFEALRVAAVTGDDIFPSIDSYMDYSILETGEPLRNIKEKIVSANAYLGSEAISSALAEGADIVITGRVADPALTLGPMLHHFKWPKDDYEKLGKGTIMGHLLECGSQVSGGYFADPPYKNADDLWNVGFPIGEADSEGNFVITKLPQAGGVVSEETVTEQLLYEIHAPSSYLTPDVTADFTNITLETEGKDRVRVKGCLGREPNGKRKVSIGYRAGYMGEGEISYAGSGAVQRAELAAEIVRRRLQTYRESIEEIRFDIIGVNSICDGDGEPRECRLRVAAKCKDMATAKLIGEETESLYTNGPAAGGGARKYAKEIIAVASILIPKEDIHTKVIL